MLGPGPWLGARPPLVYAAILVSSRQLSPCPSVAAALRYRNEARAEGEPGENHAYLDPLTVAGRALTAFEDGGPQAMATVLGVAGEVAVSVAVDNIPVVYLVDEADPAAFVPLVVGENVLAA